MNKIPFFLLGLLILITACNPSEQNIEDLAVQEPDSESSANWSKNATIYEVNVRQYTAEGTFNAFKTHLPRLKELGVDILWIMPIHPIGEEKRKGSMGSYYAVKDYKAVNPDMGTFEDFKALVAEAHAMGFKVILDWVANHTAWDHSWVTDHPDYYTMDSLGNRPIVPEGTDWTDVADLNYDHGPLYDAMIDAMEFWVREADIDGYRCDVAGFVPMDFWKKARFALDQIKPVFMLAEWDEPEMHEAFEMTYGWDFHHRIGEIAAGKDPKQLMKEYFEREQQYPAEAYRMQFITNHDENSWKESVFDRYGDLVAPLAVLTFTIDGMPLIYSGQEVGMDKSLAFFDKDEIDWKESEWTDFYQKLIELNKTFPPLWNGIHGADAEMLESPEGCLHFRRSLQKDTLEVLLNFTDSGISLPAETQLAPYMKSAGVELNPQAVNMPAQSYLILTSQN